MYCFCSGRELVSVYDAAFGCRSLDRIRSKSQLRRFQDLRDQRDRQIQADLRLERGRTQDSRREDLPDRSLDKLRFLQQHYFPRLHQDNPQSQSYRFVLLPHSDWSHHEDGGIGSAWNWKRCLSRVQLSVSMVRPVLFVS